MPILLEDLDLRKAERLLCQNALARAGSIVEAAQLLGITRHALKRRMLKHRLEWPLATHSSTSPERVASRVDPPERT
jgi:DNA-binding NtrC family response regulator